MKYDFRVPGSTTATNVAVVVLVCRLSSPRIKLLTHDAAYATHATFSYGCYYVAHWSSLPFYYKDELAEF